MEDNGLILNSHFIPTEIVTHILNLVDPDDLIYKCRFVCRNWNQIITDAEVWKLKIRMSNRKLLSKFNDIERKRLKIPWHVYYQVYCKDPFEKNLLLNNCGQNNNECWNYCYVAPGFPTGSCTIEPYPVGADPLPECDDFGGYKSCFVTSHKTCRKEQIIDLYKNGLSKFVLDEMQPKIIASEWFAGRFDCGCKYSLTVSLVSSDGESVIKQKNEEKRVDEPLAHEWQKVSIEFENYGSGVRFVVFNHSGKDTRYWAGYYGAKMAGGVVKVTL